MTAPRNLVNLKDVAKGYGSRSVLRGVTLGLAAGDRIGVVGRNGDGKSTLLRLVAGFEEPDAGAVTRNGTLDLALLGQGDELEAEGTAREQLAGGRPEHEWAADNRFRAVLDGLLGGEAWSAEQSTLPDIARTSLIVNLLTEDNLPSYHHEIATVFGRDGAWGTWVHRWTAEEDRHGNAIRDYLLAARSVDPVALERARMNHMMSGYENIHGADLLRSLAYVSFQELATRISHRNTGKVTNDPIADKMLARISKDENLHMVFYRNIVAAALEIAPDATMRAIARPSAGPSPSGAS